MNPDFEQILEDCLVKMHSGASLEDCLSAYPSQAEALSPLLLASARVRKIARPQARPEAVQAGLERLRGAVSTQKTAKVFNSQPISKPWFTRYAGRILTNLQLLLFGKETKGMKFALRIAIDMVVILLLGGVMTVGASAPSLPGDPLYSVKRTWEEVRLSLTVNDQTRQQLQDQIQQLRLDEVRAMIQKGRTGTVEFYGVVESITANELVVSGIRISMLPETLVDGVPVIGQRVQVTARVQNDGTVIALQVSLQTQLQNQNPIPLPTQMPPATPMPSQVPWSTYDHPNGMPGPTYQPTYQPWSTYDHPDMMPGATPWPYDNHNDNHNQCQDCGPYYDNGNPSWSGNNWGMHH